MIALKSGLIHAVLAGCCFAAATWLAVASSGGRCSDTNSCLEVSIKFVGFNLVGYALAFTLWGVALHRMLRVVSADSARRASSAAALQLFVGATVLIGGIAANEPWTAVGVVVALVLLPGTVAWWAAPRPETDQGYVPWWRRPGW